MAITNTWSVSDMQHTDADGGVFLVYWSMVAANVTGQDSEGNDITDPTLLLKAASCVVSMTLQARPISHTLT
jgi:hypothetical protein